MQFTLVNFSTKLRSYFFCAGLGLHVHLSVYASLQTLYYCVKIQWSNFVRSFPFFSTLSKWKGKKIGFTPTNEVNCVKWFTICGSKASEIIETQKFSYLNYIACASAATCVCVCVCFIAQARILCSMLYGIICLYFVCMCDMCGEHSTTQKQNGKQI